MQLQPITSSTILDYLAQACQRVKGGDPDGATWVWFRCMSQVERIAFDLFLVKMGDELAQRAGTPESRFVERVRRMVEA